jgi:hypothetical protein
VISKVLRARLKTIIPEIISPTQSAFVPRRLITDNVLVAFESYHTLNKKKEGKYGVGAIKSDMHKAYDLVEWVFMEKHSCSIRVSCYMNQIYYVLCWLCQVPSEVQWERS